MKTNKGRFGRTSALAGVLLFFIAPYWTRITEWMLRGADSSHGSLLAQAMELCTRKYGRCQWPMIPEECWQEVYERFMAAKDLPV